MADVTILEAISLLTKVSADSSSMIKKLSDRIDNGSTVSKGKKEKKELVQKASPVIVTDFGKAAEKDLARLGGNAEKERQNTEKEKNKNSNLLKLLGLAGAAALAMKFLFDGEGFTGLVQGFQNAVKTVTKFASKVKGLVDDIGKRLGTFADDVGKRVGTLVDNIMAKTGQWAAKAKTGIKNAMDDIGKKLGSFGDEIVRGAQKAINSVKNVAGRVSSVTKSAVTGVAGGATDDVLKTTAKVAARTTGKGAINAMTSSISPGIQTPGKPTRTGGASPVKPGGPSRLDNITKRLKGLLGKIKPLKLMKGLLKSPFLAPIVETFFTMGDVKGYVKDYGAGELSLDELNNKTGTRLIQSITALLGGAGGAMLGGILGSPIPLAGNIAGAIIGGILGDVGGRFVGKLLAPALGKNVSGLGEFALSSPLFKMPEMENIEDGIITRKGKVIKPSADDTIYAMKDGGPLGEALNKTPKMLGSLIDVEIDSLKLMQEQNSLLKAILEKTGSISPAVNMQNNKQTNFNQSGDTFRSLQMGY
tara:strand:- start:5375 stop:6970 length:1596 start_codon:yes stop_codon:yes gene_type:complete